MTGQPYRPTGAALAPIRARYAGWLGLDRAGVVAGRDEEPDGIRALQLIVRMERDRPPGFFAAVEVAARACAALCLDPRSEPGGEWFEAVSRYAAGHIRKVTRRARAGHWDAVGDLPGITATAPGAELRALLPGPVDRLDHRIARLQIRGTDVPRGEAASAEPAPGTLVLHPNPEVAMTLGKTMAQAGHAGMIVAALLAADRPDDLARWYRDGLPVAARTVADGRWHALRTEVADPAVAWARGGLLAVRDAGFTEIDPGTITVIARWLPPVGQ